MITAGDFRNGLTFEINGQPHIIVEFQHVKPGKGAAFVRTKYKNLITGAIREESFNPTAKFSPARVDRAEMQYLYNDGDVYYVMDTETFEQITLPMAENKEFFKFVRENTNVKVLSYNGVTRSKGNLILKVFLVLIQCIILIEIFYIWYCFRRCTISLF